MVGFTPPFRGCKPAYDIKVLAKVFEQFLILSPRVVKGNHFQPDFRVPGSGSFPQVCQRLAGPHQGGADTDDLLCAFLLLRSPPDCLARKLPHFAGIFIDGFPGSGQGNAPGGYA